MILDEMFTAEEVVVRRNTHENIQTNENKKQSSKKTKTTVFLV
jgi:hypothetical protein